MKKYNQKIKRQVRIRSRHRTVLITVLAAKNKMEYGGYVGLNVHKIALSFRLPKRVGKSLSTKERSPTIQAKYAS
uniref:Uncharacterized protein n=1 Tax=Candidatus Kentrum sp. TC TaxID=2126339 RepID=A0A451AE87_9GAMM|nr:MAG: hypothetical protein BECKTC1821E_GA0114239_11168 [Candidatus Kentron sp. TC]VFK64352.1 MAG: hypothetical protein BECKTC1821F_GA0114240_11228 [Candidatus Kentron sp. TC]